MDDGSMKLMKTAILTLSILLMAAVVTSCGNAQTTSTDSSSITAQSTTSIEESSMNATDTGSVVDLFEQYVYSDPDYDDQQLMYGLYLPADYDPSKSYPLVLFMGDASTVGSDPTQALTQCYGATIWATASEQAKHECIVAVPQYDTDGPVVNDASEATEYLDITVDLVKYLETHYSIDTDRIYNTGQSMGGMMSIAMDIKYPDMFAASFLVACQWGADLVGPMADDNLWIVVSEGDTKAYPGMDAITTTLQNAGAKVSRATWDRDSTAERFAAEVAEMIAEGANVNYTVLTDGDHMSTFDLAYQIEGIRDWLFQQTLPAKD